MKKWIRAIIIVGLLSTLAFGVVIAQDTTPETPACPNCPFGTRDYGGNQVLHSYIVGEYAEVLGITEAELESYRESGVTLFQIVEDLNLDKDAVSQKLQQIRQNAIQRAFEEGTLSEEDYQFLMDRAEFGHGFGRGMGSGNGTGGGFGKHQGGRGGYGAQDCPNNQAGPDN